MTKRNGTAQELAVLPVGMIEPNDVRSLHRLLAALGDERREVERLLAEQAHGLIVDEVARWFSVVDMKAVADQFSQQSQERLNRFGTEASALLRAAGRMVDARIDEMDDLIVSLQRIRGRWEESLEIAIPPVPPAFRSRNGRSLDVPGAHRAAGSDRPHRASSAGLV